MYFIFLWHHLTGLVECRSIESDFFALKIYEPYVAPVSFDPEMLLQAGEHQLGDDLVLLNTKPGKADNLNAAPRIHGSSKCHGNVRLDNDANLGLWLVQGFSHDPLRVWSGVP